MPDAYTDLDAYLALPRISGLALSPDGDRLVTGVGTLDKDATRYVSALWEVDSAGERPARRCRPATDGSSCGGAGVAGATPRTPI